MLSMDGWFKRLAPAMLRVGVPPARAAGRLVRPVVPVRTLRRDGEAPSWAWVAGGVVPVPQLLPWLYPMADRDLYTNLPGLVGAGGSRDGAPTP